MIKERHEFHDERRNHISLLSVTSCDVNIIEIYMFLVIMEHN